MSDPKVGAKSLRALVRMLSQHGKSYDAIAKSTPEPNSWTTSALKQFVRRDNLPRITPKLVGLAKTVANLIEGDDAFIELRDTDEMRSLKCFIPEQGKAAKNFDLASEVGERLRNFRRTGADISLPSSFTFARYGRDEKKIIVMLVQLKRFEKGWVFTMKITGREKSRRIVLGDVSRTAANTEFTGIAYSVNSSLTDEEFFKLNGFDLDETVNLTSQMELGLERFSMSNVDMAYPLVPTAFVGLDGSGKPISGIGAIIDDSLRDQFQIPEHVSSSVDCARKNKNLQKVMKWCNSRTNLMPEDGAAAVQIKFFEHLSLE